MAALLPLVFSPAGYFNAARYRVVPRQWVRGTQPQLGRSQAELCAAARFPTFVGFLIMQNTLDRKMLAVFQDFKDLRAEAFFIFAPADVAHRPCLFQ